MLFDYLEKPSPMPLKMPFSLGETLDEGVLGAKASFFGFKWGTIK